MDCKNMGRRASAKGRAIATIFWLGFARTSFGMFRRVTIVVDAARNHHVEEHVN